VREYRDAAALLPLALEPLPPTPAVRSRLLDAVAPPAQRSAPVFTRVFWAAAAIFLAALLFRSLRSPVDPATMELRGDRPSPSAKGRLLWRGRSAELTLAGLPALPAGQVYQLWHIGPAPRPVPQAAFSVDGEGGAHVWDTLRFSVARGDAFAVTREPSGGSRSPTIPFYVVPGR